MLLTHKIDLDVQGSRKQDVILITQNDLNAHRILITMRNGSVPIIFHAGDTATIESDSGVTEEAILHDESDLYMPNVIEYMPSSIITRDSINKRMTVKVYEADTPLNAYYAPSFEIYVREDPTAESDLMNSDEYSGLVKAKKLTEEYASAAKDALTALRNQLAVDEADNGKILRVVDGAWALK